MVGSATAQDPTPYPAATGKKGLQVQMIDDARTLRVAHALVQCDLAELFDADGGADAIEVAEGGRKYWFAKRPLEALEARIGPLSAQGVLVTVQLVAIRSAKAARARCVLHPQHDLEGPRTFAALDSVTPDGKAWLAAAMKFLARRWQPRSERGQVWNWIVGSKANAHRDWNNMGLVAPERAVGDYEQAVRIVHDAVTGVVANARVHVAVDGHWISQPAPDVMAGVGARDFLARFGALARERGDFGWHVAIGADRDDPYEPRFWRDPAASLELDTPTVTVRNLGVLVEFLRGGELTWQGRTRRVLATIRGFHCSDRSDGEQVQAAALAAALQVVERLDGVDALILGRHVDQREGGLHLGLWSRKSASQSEPEARRLAHRVFAAAGTTAWAETIAFARPLVGAEGWPEPSPLPASAQPPR